MFASVWENKIYVVHTSGKSHVCHSALSFLGENEVGGKEQPCKWNKSCQPAAKIKKYYFLIIILWEQPLFGSYVMWSGQYVVACVCMFAIMYLVGSCLCCGIILPCLFQERKTGRWCFCNYIQIDWTFSTWQTGKISRAKAYYPNYTRPFLAEYLNNWTILNRVL